AVSTYTVVVSNGVGTATSSVATLTVNWAPSITTQPASQTVTAGATATFSGGGDGGAPLTYQWQKNGADISGANRASCARGGSAGGGGGGGCGQHVQGRSEQQRDVGDQHRGDADGERGAGGHDAAGEPDGDGAGDGDVQRGGERDGAAELPVAEERLEHQRR